jgi:hypothetical protein
MGLRLSRVILAVSLLAVGLLAASPFACDRLVGTGEAYNYSLSVADAVVQMRHGVLPPLAGQTQYAFNGRIHPLRNAPYLYYLAAAIDAATLHHLEFWEIQNASLVLSFIAATFACYAGLRWATDCPRVLALFLASTYVLSPALLCAAHSLNLLMTVHAAVFVPIAIAACVRGCRVPSFSTDASMAAALALAWLAHPPVAVWLTWGVMLVRLVTFAGRPGWRPVVSAAIAAAMGLLLCAFGFASVATLNGDVHFFAQDVTGWHNFVGEIMSNLRSGFPGCLLPVSRTGNGFTDLQFGYVAWGLLGLTLAATFGRFGRDRSLPLAPRLAAVGIVATAVLLLLLVLPIPGVTRWLWFQVPVPVLEMTFIWPMQRLYLVAVGFTVFGAGLALPGWWGAAITRRWIAAVLIAAGGAWMLYEAAPFLAIGFVNRRTAEESAASFRPSNLNLTQTSYAYVGLPPSWVNGVIDPSIEYRLLRGGEDELTSNYAAALATSEVVASGSFVVKATAHAPTLSAQSVSLVPGHRYLIVFDFKARPFDGWIDMVGPTTWRSYTLPSAGVSKGFGMLDGQRRALSLWTDSKETERVNITLHVADGTPFVGSAFDVADFTLRDVDAEKLPIRLQGYLPLKMEVDAPEMGCTVETPQRFLAGYEAWVNGTKVPVHMSPWRNVMVGVPQGRSVVEIRYTGPALANEAFWISAASWAAFLIWRISGSPTGSRGRRLVADSVAKASAISWRHKAWSAAVIVAGAAAIAAVAHGTAKQAGEQASLRAAGPIEVQFTLPYGKKLVSQPLVATGHPQAGVIVSVTPMDERHILLAADVWGALYQSSPIELDFSKEHTLVLSDSALFPLGNPRVKALTPAEVDQLRHELRIELDGSMVIDKGCYAFEAAPSEIYVGRTPFGSTSGPTFLGEIRDWRRLPIPRIFALPWGDQARMRVRFPADRVGSTEVLLSAASGSDILSYSVTYLGHDRLRITCSGPGEGPPRAAEVTFAPAKSHELDFEACNPEGRDSSFDLACDFDGTRILGSARPNVPVVRPLLVSGMNLPMSRKIENRFSGPEMEMSLTSDAKTNGRFESFGPVHLIVTLPKEKVGRHEPLLTTGKTGAGDLVYIFYEDEHHVRFGFDHWGIGGSLSEPVPVNYNEPHDLWINEGSLYPKPLAGAAWAALDPVSRKRREGQIAVVLDGAVVLSSVKPTYPSPLSAVTVARNGIGMSTADPDFSGVVHFSERTGTVLPQGLGP